MGAGPCTGPAPFLFGGPYGIFSFFRWWLFALLVWVAIGSRALGAPTVYCEIHTNRTDLSAGLGKLVNGSWSTIDPYGGGWSYVGMNGAYRSYSADFLATDYYYASESQRVDWSRWGNRGTSGVWEHPVSGWQSYPTYAVMRYADAPPSAPSTNCFDTFTISVTNPYPWSVVVSFLRNYSSGSEARLSDAGLGPLPPGVAGTWVLNAPCEDELLSVSAFLRKSGSYSALDSEPLGDISGVETLTTNTFDTNLVASFAGSKTLADFSQFTNRLSRADSGVTNADFAGVIKAIGNQSEKSGKESEGLLEGLVEAINKARDGISSDVKNVGSAVNTNSWSLVSNIQTNLWWLGNKGQTNTENLTAAVNTNLQKLAGVYTNVLDSGQVSGAVSNLISSGSSMMGPVTLVHSNAHGKIVGGLTSLGNSASSASAAPLVLALRDGVLVFGSDGPQLASPDTMNFTIWSFASDLEQFSGWIRAILTALILMWWYRQASDQVYEAFRDMLAVPIPATTFGSNPAEMGANILKSISGRLMVMTILLLMVVPVVVAIFSTADLWGGPVWEEFNGAIEWALGPGASWIENWNPSTPAGTAVGFRSIAWKLVLAFVPLTLCVSIAITQAIWYFARGTVLLLAQFVIRNVSA